MCEDEAYLTMREAAEVVRVSEAALRQRWRRYRLPVTRFGRNVLIARSVLLAHLRKQAIR